MNFRILVWELHYWNTTLSKNTFNQMVKGWPAEISVILSVPKHDKRPERNFQLRCGVISLYRVSQQVLAGSTGQNNHNGSWWVGWVYPRVVYHSKTFYFCGPLGRKYFQKKINLVSVETDFNFLYCDPSAQPIDTINGGMG